MQDTINKTLIIRLSSVGDIVLSSLLVRTLRNRFPSAQIDYLVKSEYADLVRYSPYINSTIAFPAGGKFSDLRALRQRILREGYDLLIDLHDSLRSRYLCRGSAPSVRINKRKIARALLVKGKINVYHSMGGSPAVPLRYLETLRRFGVEDDGGGLEIHLSQMAIDSASHIRHQHLPGLKGSLIGVCPAAKHFTKMWPADRFAESVASLITQRGGGAVLFGAQNERGRCEEIATLIRQLVPGAMVANVAGVLDLLQTAATMDHCDIVFTNDSGLMHIASARKRKVVAIFGSTVKELGFFPFRTESIVVEHPDLSCRPCTHVGRPVCPLGHFRCMTEIPAHRVTESALSLLAR